MQLGAGAATSCPPKTPRPGTAPRALQGSFSQWDSPAQSACPGPAGMAQAGESRLRELAGSKRARHCLIFTHQCPVFRRRPISLPHTLLCGVLPFPRPGCKVARRRSPLMPPPPHQNSPLLHCICSSATRPSLPQAEPMSSLLHVQAGP